MCWHDNSGKSEVENPTEFISKYTIVKITITSYNYTYPHSKGARITTKLGQIQIQTKNMEYVAF